MWVARDGEYRGDFGGVFSLLASDRAGTSVDFVALAPLSRGDEAPLLFGLLARLGGGDGDPLCLPGGAAGGDPLGLPGGGESLDWAGPGGG